MNFVRIGNVDLTDLELCLRCKSEDGSSLSFNLLNTSILNRAHFYDEVKKAQLDICATYAVEVSCLMQSGHIVKMFGKCTSFEYWQLVEKAGRK